MRDGQTRKEKRHSVWLSVFERKKQGGEERDNERKKDKEENSLQNFMENGDECKVVSWQGFLEI